MDEEEHCIVIESKFDANSIQSDAEFWKNKYLQLEKKNASVKKELEGIKDTLTTHTVMLQKLLKRAYPFSPKLEEKIFPLMSMEHLEKVEETIKRKPKADVANEKERKRMRTDTHRWSNAQVDALLAAILRNIDGDPEKFEKPTCRKFYWKIRQESELLWTLNWPVLKSKMRNLKTTYMEVQRWKNDTGAGLLTEDKEKIVTEYIQKKCPKFSKLVNIYGNRHNVNPPVVWETLSPTLNEELISAPQSDTEVICFGEANCVPIAQIEVVNPSPPGTTGAGNSREFESVVRQSTPRTRRPSRSSALPELQSIQKNPFQQRELLKNDSLMREEKMADNRLKIKARKWQQELEVEREKLGIEKSKIEIEKRKILSAERIARQQMEEKKLRLEMEERMKKYELELKYKAS